MKQAHSLAETQKSALPPRVLLVADSQRLKGLRKVVAPLAEMESAGSLQGAFATLSFNPRAFDMVIGTMSLSGAPRAGLRLASELRRRGFTGPILLFLEEREGSDLHYHAARLHLDYLTLPVQNGMFREQLQALLWPPPEPEPEIHSCGDLRLNADDFSLVWRGQRYYPTRLEFDLLLTLIRKPGHAFSTDELLKQLWRGGDAGLNVVRQTVRRIRKRLPPEIIETTPGGYLLRPCATGVTRAAT